MIRFFQENNHSFYINKKRLLKNYIKNVINEHKFKTRNINYIFCNDDYLLEINQQYLNHKYYTDIITFNNSESNSLFLDADIFISVDRVLENSAKLDTPFNSELCRIMLHGILHLLGYNDKTIAEKKIMRAKENYYLEKIINENNYFFHIN